ncbi:MAG: nucleoside-diphosphate kinase [Myxococcota bacterium]
MERTLSIIKPDAVSRGLVGRILALIEAADMRIVALKLVQLGQADAERFYDVHRDRPFFKSLVRFMTSGPIVVSVLEGNDAIRRYRTLMGATDPAEAEKDTIRRELAENVERNAVHGSDSPQTAEVEIPFFFSRSEIVQARREGQA